MPKPSGNPGLKAGEHVTEVIKKRGRVIRPDDKRLKANRNPISRPIKGEGGKRKTTPSTER